MFDLVSVHGRSAGVVAPRVPARVSPVARGVRRPCRSEFCRCGEGNVEIDPILDDELEAGGRSLRCSRRYRMLKSCCGEE